MIADPGVKLSPDQVEVLRLRSTLPLTSVLGMLTTEPDLDGIGSFVFAKLAAANLRSNGPAMRADLIRRVTYDLTGLPPTPAEIAAFVSDESPDAYEQLVDRLLASPRYGEYLRTGALGAFSQRPRT